MPKYNEWLVVDLYHLESKLRGANLRTESPQSPTRTDETVIEEFTCRHGGDDPGSIGFDGEIKEKDVTLAISKLLKTVRGDP